ncbi:unnamed protein product [Diatraea saccharalis]|uniref:Uncharacterized protein n=1 Tax=Diatraea saccharalis TaxID=40085 RepID=A0A9P0C7K5_9NEOP|nr:unnamed protein product [Diatraea saccharalis]
MSIQSNKKSYFLDNSDIENNVADLMSLKGYLPNEKHFPKSEKYPSVSKSAGKYDVTYLLSKLSDEELLKLLNEQPKKTEYDLNDIVRFAFDSKYVQDIKTKSESVDSKPREVNGALYDENKKFRTVTGKEEPRIAFFRLENKQVDPYSVKADSDPNYVALQKLNNMLYSRPSELEKDDKSNEDDAKKELLFDVLVAQLKTLCCKRTKSFKRAKKHDTPNDLHPIINMNSQNHKLLTNEHMFLIINDEIRSNGSDELISVDPDSLELNSSVLLLGPIATPLTDFQLRLVMSRISNELSKPEYLPLLQQLSDGTLSGNNIKLMKSLVTGPETRRYIKPHRCNYQSKLARIYGGPKWLICTGYLNLNTPSLYD